MPVSQLRQAGNSISHRKRHLIIATTAYFTLRSMKHKPKVNVNRHPGASNNAGLDYVKKLLSEPEYFFNATRLNISTFLQLKDWLIQKNTLAPERVYAWSLSLEEKLVMFLWMVARGASIRDTRDRFRHSHETIHRNFHQVLNALEDLYDDFVLPPGDTIPSRISKDWDKMRYFANARGAIDGTHISVHVPEHKRAPFRNRKGTLSQNVLMGCTFDMRFFYVLPGWEGSAGDTRVLDSALIDGEFPMYEGRYYLGDGGYGFRKGFLIPYKSVRYHLHEFGRAVDSRPKTMQELYNLRHAQLRNVIERCLGVLKRRWKILQVPPEYALGVQNKLMLVLPALHNFIRSSTSEEDAVYLEVDREMRDMQREKRRNFLERKNRGHFEDGQNEDETQQDGELSYNTENRLSEQEGRKMSKLRDEIVQKMWENYLEICKTCK